MPPFSDRLCSRSTLKTLAASVDATTEPQQQTADPVEAQCEVRKGAAMPAVAITPRVLSSTAGTATGLARSMLVLKPP